MIILSSERMIVGSLKMSLFVKNGLTVGQKYFDLGPPVSRARSSPVPGVVAYGE